MQTAIWGSEHFQRLYNRINFCQIVGLLHVHGKVYTDCAHSFHIPYPTYPTPDPFLCCFPTKESYRCVASAIGKAFSECSVGFLP